MKLRAVLLFGLVLVGCQQGTGNETEVVEADDTTTVQSEINKAWIENEIIYIETLIGIEDMESARLALSDLLFSIDGEVSDELQQARINTIITLLEGVDFEADVGGHHHDFTGTDAVAIAMEHYEVSDDIIFRYHAQPSHFGEDQVGYYVALKSVSLMESDADSDGIVMMLFVTDDGRIAEIRDNGLIEETE